jgi:tetratricopeptide (TPR) repeat protein
VIINQQTCLNNGYHEDDKGIYFVRKRRDERHCSISKNTFKLKNTMVLTFLGFFVLEKMGDAAEVVVEDGVTFDEVWKKTLDLADDNLTRLLDIKATFFSVDRKEKSLKIQEIISSILSATELGSRRPTTTQDLARTFYIRGKALDCKEEYCEQAEFELARAVKLNPMEYEYWNAIAHCFWKKGDIKTAQSCFTSAIKQQNNQVSLRELSKLLRQFPVRSSEEKASMLQESLEKAKEAVCLDVNDSESWYTHAFTGNYKNT